MKKLNIKKLKLKKDTLNSLNSTQMKNLLGGARADTAGTGYGMCVCNATDKCCTEAGSKAVA